MIFTKLRHAALIAATVIAAIPAHAESLADAMVTAYRHSALMDQNRAVLRAADEDVSAAVGALRPVVQWTASHSYTRTYGIDSRSLTGQRIEFDSNNLTSSLQLLVQMTLYDWGRGALAIDSAKELVLASREALVSVEQDVLLAAVTGYFNVRSATEQVTLQENSVRVISQERQAAQDRFDVGEITVTDVSLADARLAATRAQLAAAQGDLEVARQRYIAATGKKPGKLSAPPALPKLPGSLDAARSVSQRKHPAIKQVQHQVAASEIGVAIAKAQRKPNLTGRIAGSIQRSTSQSLGGARDTTRNVTAGVELSQTLYAGGRLASGERKAMANRDEARAGLLQISRQVSEQVGIAWANIDVARAQIRAIDQQIVAAQQAYDGVREEVTLGARTTLDVLDAEQSLLSAKADKISAEANLQLAHYQLLAAMGLLTVENLKLGIPTYDPSEYYKAVRDAPARSSQGEALDRVLRGLGKSN